MITVLKKAQNFNSRKCRLYNPPRYFHLNLKVHSKCLGRLLLTPQGLALKLDKEDVSVSIRRKEGKNVFVSGHNKKFLLLGDGDALTLDRFVLSLTVDNDAKVDDGDTRYFWNDCDIEGSSSKRKQKRKTIEKQTNEDLSEKDEESSLSDYTPPPSLSPKPPSSLSESTPELPSEPLPEPSHDLAVPSEPSLPDTKLVQIVQLDQEPSDKPITPAEQWRNRWWAQTATLSGIPNTRIEVKPLTPAQIRKKNLLKGRIWVGKESAAAPVDDQLPKENEQQEDEVELLEEETPIFRMGNQQLVQEGKWSIGIQQNVFKDNEFELAGGCAIKVSPPRPVHSFHFSVFSETDTAQHSKQEAAKVQLEVPPVVQVQKGRNGREAERPPLAPEARKKEKEAPGRAEDSPRAPAAPEEAQTTQPARSKKALSGEGVNIYEPESDESWDFLFLDNEASRQKDKVYCKEKLADGSPCPIDKNLNSMGICKIHAIHHEKNEIIRLNLEKQLNEKERRLKEWEEEIRSPETAKSEPEPQSKAQSVGAWGEEGKFVSMNKKDIKEKASNVLNGSTTKREEIAISPAPPRNVSEYQFSVIGLHLKPNESEQEMKVESDFISDFDNFVNAKSNAQALDSQKADLKEHVPDLQREAMQVVPARPTALVEPSVDVPASLDTQSAKPPSYSPPPRLFQPQESNEKPFTVTPLRNVSLYQFELPDYTSQVQANAPNTTSSTPSPSKDVKFIRDAEELFNDEAFEDDQQQTNPPEALFDATPFPPTQEQYQDTPALPPNPPKPAPILAKQEPIPLAKQPVPPPNQQFLDDIELIQLNSLEEEMEKQYLASLESKTSFCAPSVLLQEELDPSAISHLNSLDPFYQMEIPSTAPPAAEPSTKDAWQLPKSTAKAFGSKTRRTKPAATQQYEEMDKEVEKVSARPGKSQQYEQEEEEEEEEEVVEYQYVPIPEHPTPAVRTTHRDVNGSQVPSETVYGGNQTNGVSQDRKIVYCYCNIPAQKFQHQGGIFKGKSEFKCGRAAPETPCNFKQWENAPLCFHSKPCSLFIVKKEGPNKGRWFWTCSVNSSDKCKKFEWDSARN
eukprot:TRINITY_DN6674_c1_g1_i3.p1 TRINITY_DN6674_c1_g1~~TRINITY_DN6674_c1_g1_i3.p1  ORF type:complete len:1079 (-),score=359.71 TRINITY_DN6674_c1_g1_i3:904-4140(-)